MPRLLLVTHAADSGPGAWRPLCGTAGGPERRHPEQLNCAPEPVKVTCRRCRVRLGLEGTTRSSLGPVRDHRLTTWDFRFLQAWVQKLDLNDAWQRYQSHIGPPHARRIAHRGVTLLRQLKVVAARLGESDAGVLLRDAELIRLDAPSAVADPGPSQVPTLESFRESLDDPDYYSERELLERWTELYGAQAAEAGERAGGSDRARSRRRRLMSRQVALLQRLERSVATPPQPGDAIGAWLQPRLAARLSDSGVRTVADLQARAVAGRARWYRSVPRLGAVGARAIEAWLARHTASLGRPEPAVSALMPLERWALAERGGEGVQGRPGGRGREDLDMVREWLEAERPRVSPATWRCLRKEAERLLLWAVHVRGCRLGALKTEDAQSFLRFLGDPPPAWCGPRGARRGSADWRPLEGPLSAPSIATSLALLRLVFDGLLRSGKTSHNPWRGP